MSRLAACARSLLWAEVDAVADCGHGEPLLHLLHLVAVGDGVELVGLVRRGRRGRDPGDNLANVVAQRRLARVDRAL
eukprot:2960328-Pleurochrysis_carterae.AAC.2